MVQGALTAGPGPHPSKRETGALPTAASLLYLCPALTTRWFLTCERYYKTI